MCGVIGIIECDKNCKKEYKGRFKASYEAYRGLLIMQHRGQDAAGILSYDNIAKKFSLYKDLGLVAAVFNKKELDRLNGNIVVGHTRYATSGSDERGDLQPIVSGNSFGVGMAHNGNLVNYYSKADQLREEEGIQLLTTNDLEIILNIWCNRQFKMKFSFKELTQSVRNIFESTIGGYATVGLVAGKGLFAFRDPHGIRPLCFGEKVENGVKRYCFASESNVLNFLGYKYVRDVRPAEFIFIDYAGELSSFVDDRFDQKDAAQCMFEWVYFSGADSEIDNRSVYSVRLKLGVKLADKVREVIERDNLNGIKDLKDMIVVPVPDTSRPSAIALAQTLELPYREALIKNRYVQRSFILSSKESRDNMVMLKLSPIRSEIEGKKIILVDDSIVRGTTARRIISLLKQYGAKEIILVSTCPPIRYPCYYGIDFPSADELVAAKKSEKEIAAHLGISKVIYLGIDELKDAIGTEQVCAACLSNSYPTDVKEGEAFGKRRRDLV